MTPRLEHEKKVVAQMISIYCSHYHNTRGTQLCEECSNLENYAVNRLEHCIMANKKRSCRKCVIHCYSPVMREKIRLVMRYSGPRMIYKHPIAAIRHLLNEII